MVGLSQEDFKDLMKEGYSVAEINTAIREVEQEELQKSYDTTRMQDPRAFSQHSQLYRKTSLSGN